MDRSLLLEVSQKVYSSQDWEGISCLVITVLGEADKKENGGNRPGKEVQGFSTIVQLCWNLDNRIHKAPCTDGLLTAQATKEEC